MRLIILCLVCCAILCIGFYHAQDEDRIQKQREDHRRYYLELLKTQKTREKNGERRAEFLNQLAISAETSGWDHALHVGKVYHRGCYPDFRPNARMASSIYRALVTKCEDTAVVSEAQGLLHQCTLLSVDDMAGEALPLEPGENVLGRLHAIIKVPPPIVRMRKPVPPPVQRQRTEIERIIDTQNSHDHGVTSSMKSILNSLRAQGVSVNTSAREEIEDVLFSEKIDMTDEDKAKALAVLDSLNKAHIHSALGVTECDALGLVWSKVSDSPEILCKQLASGFERGTPVCSTGKIARIVSALDGVTPDARITPIWAVKEELGSLAAKIRSDTLESVSEMHRGAYERGDSMELEEKMRAAFTDQALATYCGDGGLGMEKAVIDPIVQSIAAGF